MKYLRSCNPLPDHYFSFGQKNLVGLVFGANVALSVFVKGSYYNHLNTFVDGSTHIHPHARIRLMLMLMLTYRELRAFEWNQCLCQ